MRTSPNQDPLGRLIALVALASALVFLAILAWPLMIGAVWHADDLGSFHLPFRLFYARSLAHGDDPRWCSLVHCGFYLHGEGQLGLDHFWHRFLYAFLEPEHAFSLEFWCNYPLLFAGTAIFLRRRVGRVNAALVGALLFTFSGFNLLHYVHLNAISIVAHMPWLLLLTETVFCSKDKKTVAWARLGLGILTASQVLLGYPQYVAFSSLVETAFAFWLRANGLANRRSAWVDWGLAKGLGALAGASQVLPTLEALRDSWRAKPPREFASMNSLHPWNIVQLFAPYAFKFRHFNDETEATLPFHEYVLYAGAIAPATWAWLWIRRRELGEREAFAKGAALLGAAALVLSLGRHSYIYTILSRLPLASMFRGPSRFALIVHFATSALASAALADLLDCAVRGDGSRPRRCFRCFGRSASRRSRSARSRSSRGLILTVCSREIVATKRLFVAPLLIGIASALIFLAARGKRCALVALVGWAVADAASYGFDYVLRHDSPSSIAALVDAEPTPPRLDDRFRVRSRNNGLSMRGTRMAGGYVALAPRSEVDEKSRDWNRLAGVAWKRDEDDPNRWEVLADPLPRVRLVDRVVVDLHPGDSIPRINLDETAVVQSELGLERSSKAGAASIVADRSGKILVEASADSRQLLIVNEHFHQGWQAFIDEKPASVVRTNGDFLGAVVEKGRHVVSFRFDPKSHRDGIFLSRIGWALLGLVTAASWVRGARR